MHLPAEFNRPPRRSRSHSFRMALFALICMQFELAGPDGIHPLMDFSTRRTEINNNNTSRQCLIDGRSGRIQISWFLTRIVKENSYSKSEWITSQEMARESSKVLSFAIDFWFSNKHSLVKFHMQQQRSNLISILYYPSSQGCFYRIFYVIILNLVAAKCNLSKLIFRIMYTM